MALVEVNGEYSEVINFAMQHNYVPIIRSLQIRNITDQRLDDIIIKIGTDPGFAYEWNTQISSIPVGETVELDNIDIKLSQSFLYSVSERINGIIKITVLQNDKIIQEELRPISVLAFDEWSGSLYMPEILTSFVIPNNEYVISVIRNASKLLEKWTGSPSFTGYRTQNPNNVRKQAAAIYEALSQENIVYSNPPASFEAVGQKVRLADTVLKQKIGTCLDLTLLYAACLEYVGINPIIILISGHAFLGIWIEDECFAESIQDDFSLISKRIADGINQICVVECTAFVAGKTVLFEQAVESAEKHFMDPRSFNIFIDVKRSRGAGIRPLPIAVRTADAGIEFVPTDIKEIRDRTKEFTNIDIEVNTEPEKYTKQQMWERKLLDMNLRNTLINFRFISGGT